MRNNLNVIIEAQQNGKKRPDNIKKIPIIRIMKKLVFSFALIFVCMTFLNLGVKAECINAHFDLEESIIKDPSKVEEFLDEDIHTELYVKTMKLETEYEVDPNIGEYDAKWFVIKPAVSGTYWIRFYTPDFEQGYLYNVIGRLFEKTPDGHYKYLPNDNDYDGGNPEEYYQGITCDMEAGKEYYLCAGYFGLWDRMNYKIAVHKKGKTIKKLELFKKEGALRYHYELNDWSDVLQPLKITYQDNTVKTLDFYSIGPICADAMTVDPYGNEIYLKGEYEYDYYDDFCQPIGDIRFSAYIDSDDNKIESNQVSIPRGKFSEYAQGAVNIPIGQEKSINKHQLYSFHTNESGIYRFKETVGCLGLNVLDSLTNTLYETEGYNNNDDPSYRLNHYYTLDANSTYFLYYYGGAQEKSFELKIEKINEPKSEHNWHKQGLVSLKYARCTETGKDRYVCWDNVDKPCTATKEVIIPATGHDFKVEKVVRGTCTSKGYVVYECANNDEDTDWKCSEVKRVETPVVSTNHDKQFEWRNARTATHTQDGYSGDQYCKACNKLIKTGTKIEKTKEHVWGTKKITKEPTCKDTGVYTYTCDLCGDVKTETVPVDSLKHIETVVGEKPATNNGDGYSGDTICSLCKKILTKGIVIPQIKIHDSNTGTSDQSQLININKITINTESYQIAAGKKLQLKVDVQPQNATNKTVKWTSSNKGIATVSASGLVVFKKNTGGKKVIITALSTDGSGRKSSISLTSMKGYVKKIKITGAKSVRAGKKLSLKAKVTATRGANKKVNWISNNTNYATVNAKGVVSTKKGAKGKTVKISIKSLDGTNKTNTIKIKIK